MEKQQELEWLEAQNIVISEDLVAFAKKQLQFLAVVDRHRCLYEGPTLQKAIYRYNACWLPLLAKHSESQITKGPLVIPLDCEWIWHCHRLNPVRYKTDCEELYGRILDNYNVVSSVQGTSTSETEEIWKTQCPNEPYLLDLARDFSKDTSEKVYGCEKHTKYDMVSAVKRQSPFCYQVSRRHMNNQVFLETAVARYKGFLYLIKRNRERSIKSFCVPTYDIDLIWHSHQLHPVSYCKDLCKLIGKVLEHDDTDSDRSKGKKLDVGFSETTRQWEETFGSRYWRAGAMHRGPAPSPLTTSPYSPNIMTKKEVAPYDCQKIIQLPEVKVVEVLLEIVGVKNLPVGHKGNLFVSFSKTQPDTFFNAKRRLTIFSETGEKQVASFQCEPTGELLFQLTSHSPSNLPNLPISWTSKKMGSTSLSLQDFLNPMSRLSLEKWFELVPSSGNVSSKSISLRIAISCTVPSLAPRIFQSVCSRPFLRSSCFFPLPGRVQHAKRWTRVIDEAGREVISLQMRDSKNATAGDTSVSTREVIGVTKSLETITLAESADNGWSLLDNDWCLKLEKKSGKDGHLFELMGNTMVKIYPGRKLEFESKHCERQKKNHGFFTAIEFSAEVPYGRAVALLDLKSGFLKVNEEWLVLPGIILVFILSDILRKEGWGGFTLSGDNLKEMENLTGSTEDENPNLLSTIMGTEVALKMEVAEANAVLPEEGRSHSGGCGSGGCGGCGGCGGGCGNMSKSGGCGGCGGCGGGCGNRFESGGCGGCGGRGSDIDCTGESVNRQTGPAPVTPAVAKTHNPPT